MSPAFDPSAAAPEDSGIFGLPHGESDATVHVVPVPFDATTSYRKGTARGPDAVFRASKQVDLFDVLTGKPYEAGIVLLPEDPRIVALNAEASELAQPIIDVGGVDDGTREFENALARVNAIGDEVNAIVESICSRAIAAGKLVGVLGGDHSTPFGAFAAAAKRWPGLGLMHFDAHADLRVAYEGFTWSHASIFHNAMTRIPGIARLLQVGLRDLSEPEYDAIRHSGGRIQAMFDVDWAFARAEGANLRALVRRSIECLPEHVWVSFDVDGFDPALCPNTGTPVPGGLSFNEAMLWLDELAKSGRTIVGFDVNEVSPGDASSELDSWDAVVGARLLYRLIGFALRTRGHRI